MVMLKSLENLFERKEMAFACVISLMNTIERLLNSSHISIVAPSREIIELANNELKSLQETLKRLDGSSKNSSRKRENALDRQIKEAICKLEDLIESHVSNQVISQSERPGDGIQLSIDVQDLRQDVYSFVETVKKMEEEYVKVLDNPLPEEDDGAAVSSSTGFGGKKSKLVGLSDMLSRIINQITQHKFPGFPVFSLVGMAGIGKTTLAKEIFEDPDIVEYFDCRMWVTVGRKCQISEIIRGILAQVDPDMDKMPMGRDEEIAPYLYQSLKGKKHFIVLDDVWDTRVWDCLDNPFTDYIDGGSRILLTTRLRDEILGVRRLHTFGIQKIMQLLNKEESWDLLHHKVFGEDSCPLQLEKAGKKIAENCDGLPLMIVTVADLLSNAEKTLEYWNKVAEKQNSVFMDAYDEIFKVLYPSYEYLPQHLKPCFLHMGVFPQEYEIPQSKLINMWIAEGFLEPNMTQTIEHCAMKNLVELVSNSLVIVHLDSTILSHSIKTCRLHSSLWHLCNREAGKNKFFHVLNSCADGLGEDIKSQRRLCIHNNILFFIKDVYNSMEDDASTTRSLLCFGSYHQYPVPICFKLRFLRVLDALKIRLYEFPVEVLKLVQLRYLGLTYNGELPASISKLWSLQFLIIHRDLSIKFCEASSYVPIEIWDMQELKHIEIVGSNLPSSSCGASLKNLSKLLSVSAHSCTKGVLKRISNLKKLGIEIELEPDYDSEPFRGLNRILRLRKLQSLKCVLVNPELRSQGVALPAPRSMFPSSLQKLHLSGLGYPWEYMNIISSLPNLNVLKLRNYAFCGPSWETDEFKFRMPKFLVIEDSDLVRWKVGSGSFPRLRNLSIKHCYQLEEFHWEFDYFFKKIEVVDSNPLAVTFIDRIKSRRGRTFRDVYVHSSWDDGNLKS